MSIATNRKQRLSEAAKAAKAAKMANVPGISVSNGAQGGVMHMQVLKAFVCNMRATH
jgi:hypothetical protein